MPDLVLLRHGQSVWNAENLFTGWYDADLSEQGEHEARQAGQLLGEVAGGDGTPLDLRVVHTSVLTRAIRTANLALDELGRSWLPVRRHWRLNERHYGDLQGRNKKETAERYGLDQVKAWRRSYDVPPPPLAPDDERHPRFDLRYRGLAPSVLPASECLADVVARVVPYWEDAIAPDLLAGLGVLVVAHGNSLRGLVKFLLHISDAEIPGLEIATGVPWHLHLDDDLQVVHEQLLGDAEAIAKAREAVARQAG